MKTLAFRMVPVGIVLLLAPLAAQGQVPGPSFKQVLSLRSVSGPRMAPDGSAVAFVVRSADWEENRFDREIWLVRKGQAPFELTRTAKGSSSSPRWSPDGQWLAFLADRGDGNQVYMIRPAGGEAFPLTAVNGGVSSFTWAPAGKRMAVSVTEPEADTTKARKKRFGEWTIGDGSSRMTHLWLLDVSGALESGGRARLPKPGHDGAEGGEVGEGTEEEAEQAARTEADKPGSFFRRLTGGPEFTVGNFEWSPDGTEIAFDHRPDTRITSFQQTDLSVVEVPSGEIRPLVVRSGLDGSPIWSPDGAWILFRTDAGDSRYYMNNRLARVPVGGGGVQTYDATAAFNFGDVEWIPAGVRFVAWQRTRSQLFGLDPGSGEVGLLADSPRNLFDVDYSADGREVAILAETPMTLREIYRSQVQPWQPEPVTAMTRQVGGWSLGTREVIRWKSRDGTPIEGVLFKPEGFDPGRRYPLLVVIHGGPSGIDYPDLIESYVYPVTQWLAKGALVLQPNYRGSIGYGQDFRALNVRNLGVGDAWDVLSGVDALIARGIADPDSLGAMGWSEGGYISAFLSTTSDRFRAISVGAGISDWMTYYVNTDIHPFTRHYLGATPWEDPKIYAKTSPITYIRKARTPTLIQHGENDRRVPIPNAYELYQGLKDVGVKTRLIVYKGFGHPITKPKERLAAMWHNWQWFAAHVWGETVELPEK